MSYEMRIIYWSSDFFFFKHKTAYELRISDGSSDVCSSDLVLEKVSEAYHQNKSAIAQNVKMLVGGLRNMAKPQSRDRLDLSNDALDQVAGQLPGHVDPQHGGIGGAPKFPQTGLFDLLRRHYLRSGSAEARRVVVNTITQMAQGGIYDHLGGGFARYSPDAEWLAPHFEKMLYDNAQLLSPMALIEAETHDPLLLPPHHANEKAPGMESR